VFCVLFVFILCFVFCLSSSCVQLVRNPIQNIKSQHA
jgi:hypothetical protein